MNANHLVPRRGMGHWGNGVMENGVTGYWGTHIEPRTTGFWLSWQYGCHQVGRGYGTTVKTESTIKPKPGCAWPGKIRVRLNATLPEGRVLAWREAGVS
jgi:hypothetical protein